MYKDPAERFSTKYVVDESGCWNWNYPNKKTGYGKFRLYGKYEAAHRASWILHNGNIPTGINVCHTCDNRACVNPEHLFLGTDSDNMKDMLSKGRGNKPYGSRVGTSKLTEDQILSILEDSRSYKTIAKEYGIHYNHVGRIKRKERWLHI